MDTERTHYRSSSIKEASNSSHQKKLQGHHSMRVMALQLPWYFSPDDRVASQVATSKFGLLNYQAASVNLKKRWVCTFSDDWKYPFSHLVCRQTGIYQHLNHQQTQLLSQKEDWTQSLNTPNREGRGTKLVDANIYPISVFQLTPSTLFTHRWRHYM